MTDGESLRLTPQRRMILSELAKTTAHPTADELYLAVRRQMPRISLGTVYRNLAILSQAGMILRLDGGPQRRYDATVAAHYHVRCNACGCVADLPMQAVTALDERARQACDYAITGHRLEFAGLCPHCQTDSTHTP